MPITAHTTPQDQSAAIVSGTQLTLPLPQAARVGDVLIAVVGTDYYGQVQTATPGWVRISTMRGPFRDVAVFHAFTTPALPETPIFTSGGPAPRMVGYMLRLTGAHPTERVLAAGPWPTTLDSTHSLGITIPGTGTAPRQGLSVIAAYYNANYTQQPVNNVQIDGEPALFHGKSYGANENNQANNSHTGIAVGISTQAGPYQLTWGRSISNSQGLAVTIPAANPGAQWESVYTTDGINRLPAVIDGIQSEQGRVPVVGVDYEPPNHTLQSLMAEKTFYIAHRGSGDNWPEHTMQSYSSATAFGVKALELSTCTTSDGVVFCHHDNTLKRVTGLTLPAISELTWAEVQNLDINAREWLGGGAPLVKPVRLQEVLDAYAGTHVIFLEDKQGTNTTRLLDIMDSYPNDKARFLWKQWAGAGQYAAVQARGYPTWGYFMPTDFGRLQELAPRHTYLGVPHNTTDENIADAVALGKPVICWEVHYRWMRDRLKALGVRGMMTSNIPYVYTTQEAQLQSDTFSTGRRGHGDLPHTIDNGWSIQPKVIAGDPGVLRFDMKPAVGYVLGSMCPINKDSYTIDFEMRFEGETAISGAYHAGLWFGHDNDQAHRSGVGGDIGGYHLIQRATGVLDVMRHDPGSSSGVLLSSTPGPAPTLNEWMSYRVTVTPHTISAVRLDNPSMSLSTNDTQYRGGYFGLQKNYSVSGDAPFAPVEFRRITWV